MKKFITAILIVLTMLLTVSCSDSDVPEGMQLVDGSDEQGYYFYAPEEWVISNLDDVKSAYASRVNVTSVSFAKVDPNVGNTENLPTEEYFFTKYFENSLSEFTIEPTVTVMNEECLFGKEGEEADRAVKYVYNFSYSEPAHKFGFMQILLKKNNDYYIFTYSSLLEEKSEGTTYYDFYLEKTEQVMTNFRFVDKTGQSGGTTDTQDGFVLISDKKIAGFELYVPCTFKPDYSSAIVSATHADGSNINMSEATGTGASVSDYYNNRKNELSEIVGEITEIEVEKRIELPDTDYAFSFEYKFSYNQKVFHVYQVVIRHGFSGYVFTYTATEDNYNLHINEVKEVLNKIVY